MYVFVKWYVILELKLKICLILKFSNCGVYMIGEFVVVLLKGRLIVVDDLLLVMDFVIIISGSYLLY